MRGTFRAILAVGLAAALLGLSGPSQAQDKPGEAAEPSAGPKAKSRDTARGKKADPVQSAAERAARLRRLFERLDADGDRVLTRAEVPEKSIKAFDRLLARGDEDGDGSLSGAEMRTLAGKVQAATPRVRPAAAKGATPPAARPAAAAEAVALIDRLRAMDRNGDEKVGREEYAGPPGLFARLDSNADGAIDKQEAEAFTKRLRQSMLRRFQTMDSNKDGKVTRDEFTGRPEMFDRHDTNKDGVLTDDDNPPLPLGPASGRGFGAGRGLGGRGPRPI